MGHFVFIRSADMRRLIFIITAVCLATVFFSSCGKKENDEPTKKADQSELARMSRQQDQMPKETTKQNKPVIGSISDNPAFYNSGGISAKAPEVKDLDSVIRPILKKLFGDAKIIAESKEPETRVDGEVVENSFAYVVKQILVPEDGTALHTALHDAHFGLSPRLGGKPTIWTGGAGMSLFKSTSLRSYSLVINMDTKKQQIVIESYKLGSKYDRLM
jgi:hypothetical protein